MAWWAALHLCLALFMLRGDRVEAWGADELGEPPKEYAGGAPPGVTGGFGEFACDACHFDFELNIGGGKFELSGVPERFTPGESYPLTLTLVRSEMRAGGFQLASRFAEGGEQAGILAPTEEEKERLSVVSHSGVQYLQQTDLGSRPTLTDTLHWSFLWTAPLRGGAVTFDASGNAADGDGSTAGDYIFTLVAGSEGP